MRRPAAIARQGLVLLLAGLIAVLVSCAEEGPVNPWHPELAGSIGLVIEPTGLDAGWTLAGPDGWRREGIGSAEIETLPAGPYTVTWSTRAGWSVPTPATVTAELERRGQLSFRGSYQANAPLGSLQIDAVPDAIAAPWTLTGPDSYQRSDVGDASLTFLAVGTYTLTWGSVAGWTSPLPNPMNVTVAEGAEATASGTYTYITAPGSGALVIDPRPDSLNPPWSISGPDGYQEQGSGPTTLDNLGVGIYSLTWGSVAGWMMPTPNPATATVTDGGTASVTGTYIAAGSETGTVTIQAAPSSITPAWALSGPDSYQTSGFGSLTMQDLPAGEYTITWQPLAGWDPPQANPQNQTLLPDGQITFSGTYTLVEPTYIGLFASPDGSSLATAGSWSASNTYVIHVLLTSVPATGVAGWEAAFRYQGANTVLYETDLLGGHSAVGGGNHIVTYDTPRFANANGYLHVADLHLACGSRSPSTVWVEPVSMIGYQPDELYFRAGDAPSVDRVLHEWNGEASFQID